MVVQRTCEDIRDGLRRILCCVHRRKECVVPCAFIRLVCVDVDGTRRALGPEAPIVRRRIDDAAIIIVDGYVNECSKDGGDACKPDDELGVHRDLDPASSSSLVATAWLLEEKVAEGGKVVITQQRGSVRRLRYRGA